MTRSDDRRFSNTANTDSDDAQLLDSDQRGETDHVPAPAPHVGGGDPPRAYELFGAFQIDAGEGAWASARHPVDVQEVR